MIGYWKVCGRGCVTRLPTPTNAHQSYASSRSRDYLPQYHWMIGSVRKTKKQQEQQPQQLSPFKDREIYNLAVKKNYAI